MKSVVADILFTSKWASHRTKNHSNMLKKLLTTLLTYLKITKYLNISSTSTSVTKHVTAAFFSRALWRLSRRRTETWCTLYTLSHSRQAGLGYNSLCVTARSLARVSDGVIRWVRSCGIGDVWWGDDRSGVIRRSCSWGRGYLRRGKWMGCERFVTGRGECVTNGGKEKKALQTN